ncbi:unnamed protein product [Linum tenue]|uniref:Uncharacterized protein n=1 Tax=Linum tenue TaxID=586396 RepID=A0AAV0NVL2_9ROSI|nr:unnamed protein product [Linum tenue]
MFGTITRSCFQAGHSGHICSSLREGVSILSSYKYKL